jgi:hypothetical protein
MCRKKTLEVLEKAYWLFLDSIVYVILWLLFILLILGVLIRTMIDRFIYSFFGALDTWSSWIDKLFAPRCKCKKNKQRRQI